MIEWEEKYSVGISMLDEEHKKLIGILNKAIFAKEHNDNPEEIKEVLREMTKYALTHFATEETYMDEFNYPEYQGHKEEHRDFSIETIAYRDKVWSAPTLCTTFKTLLKSMYTVSRKMVFINFSQNEN